VDLDTVLNRNECNRSRGSLAKEVKVDKERSKLAGLRNDL